PGVNQGVVASLTVAREVGASWASCRAASKIRRFAFWARSSYVPEPINAFKLVRRTRDVHYIESEGGRFQNPDLPISRYAGVGRHLARSRASPSKRSAACDDVRRCRSGLQPVGRNIAPY